MLAVTQVNPRDRVAKDTLANISSTKECVVNIVTEELATIMNETCGDYPPDISEFSALGIESEPSHSVKPYSVKAAKVRFECRLRVGSFIAAYGRASDVARCSKYICR